MRMLLAGLCAVLYVCLLGCGGHAGTPPGAKPVSVQATIYTTDPCVPCKQYVADIKRELPPDGWIVSEGLNPRAHVQIVKATDADAIEAFPTTVIRRDGREVDRFVGIIGPKQLATRINRHSK